MRSTRWCLLSLLVSVVTFDGCRSTNTNGSVKDAQDSSGPPATQSEAAIPYHGLQVNPSDHVVVSNPQPDYTKPPETGLKLADTEEKTPYMKRCEENGVPLAP